MDRTKVENILIEMGIPPNIKGFTYIADAMEIYQEKGTNISTSRVLYPKIARKNRTVEKNVERALRHAINVARGERGNPDAVGKYMGSDGFKNSASLIMLYKRISQEEESENDSLSAGSPRGRYDRDALLEDVRTIVKQELRKIFKEV